MELDKLIDTADENRKALVWSKVVGSDWEREREKVTGYISGLSNRDELKNELKKLSDKFRDLNRDLTKSMEAQKLVNLGYFRTLDEALLRRNIEDGIINKLHEATPKQLDAITDKSKGFFVYYRDFYKEIEFFKISENDN
jgi:hypothetical protein